MSYRIDKQPPAIGTRLTVVDDYDLGTDTETGVLEANISTAARIELPDNGDAGDIDQRQLVIKVRKDSAGVVTLVGYIDDVSGVEHKMVAGDRVHLVNDGAGRWVTVFFERIGERLVHNVEAAPTLELGNYSQVSTVELGAGNPTNVVINLPSGSDQVGFWPGRRLYLGRAPASMVGQATINADKINGVASPLVIPAGEWRGLEAVAKSNGEWDVHDIPEPGGGGPSYKHKQVIEAETFTHDSDATVNAVVFEGPVSINPPTSAPKVVLGNTPTDGFLVTVVNNTVPPANISHRSLLLVAGTINGFSRTGGFEFQVAPGQEYTFVHDGSGNWGTRTLEGNAAHIGYSFEFADGATILQSSHPDAGQFILENTSRRDIQLSDAFGGRVFAVQRRGKGEVGLVGVINGRTFTAQNPLFVGDKALLTAHGASFSSPANPSWVLMAGAGHQQEIIVANATPAQGTVLDLSNDMVTEVVRLGEDLSNPPPSPVEVALRLPDATPTLNKGTWEGREIQFSQLTNRVRAWVHHGASGPNELQRWHLNPYSTTTFRVVKIGALFVWTVSAQAQVENVTSVGSTDLSVDPTETLDLQVDITLPSFPTEVRVGAYTPLTSGWDTPPKIQLPNAAPGTKLVIRPDDEATRVYAPTHLFGNIEGVDYDQVGLNPYILAPGTAVSLLCRGADPNSSPTAFQTIWQVERRWVPAHVNAPANNPTLVEETKSVADPATIDMNEHPVGMTNYVLTTGGQDFTLSLPTAAHVAGWQAGRVLDILIKSTGGYSLTVGMIEGAAPILRDGLLRVVAGVTPNQWWQLQTPDPRASSVTSGTQKVTELQPQVRTVFLEASGVVLDLTEGVGTIIPHGRRMAVVGGGFTSQEVHGPVGGTVYTDVAPLDMGNKNFDLVWSETLKRWEILSQYP